MEIQSSLLRSSQSSEIQLGIARKGTHVKYNDETQMEPMLQNAVQELLHRLNLQGNSSTRHLFIAQLNGITTALHAITGVVWSVKVVNGKAVFINEDETECITAE